MTRKKRSFQAGYAYHVTIRCNNREFKLQRRECREVFLYAIKQALEKYKFKLYAVCIMSNHIHSSKPARKCHWGNKLLAGLDLKGGKAAREEVKSSSSSSPASPSPPLPIPSRRCQGAIALV